MMFQGYIVMILFAAPCLERTFCSEALLTWLESENVLHFNTDTNK